MVLEQEVGKQVLTLRGAFTIFKHFGIGQAQQD